MARFVQNRPALCLLLLLIGVGATLVYDLSGSIGATSGSRLEWVAFAVAFVLRVFTYVTLFASLSLLAGRLPAASQRKWHLTLIWSLTGCGLAAFVWWQLAHGNALFYPPEIKRFTPESEAPFAPGWTIAEVALGKERATSYTWASAIGGEFLAITLASLAAAWFLALFANLRKPRGAWFTPFVAFLVLLGYNVVVGWSFDWDFDMFIGDALVGAMIYNGIFFGGTLLSGSLTAPSVWVALIAAANITMLALWTRQDRLR